MLTCPQCGSSDFRKDGVARAARRDGTRPQRFQCMACSRYFCDSYKYKKYNITAAKENISDPVKSYVIQDEVKGLRQQLKASTQENAFQTLLLEAIKGAAPAFKAPPSLPIVKPDKKKTDTLLILNWSDHHANRVVDPLAIEGFNTYNFDIFAQRVWDITVRTIRLAQAQYTFENRIVGLAINALGDIGNDSQRFENMRTNELAENVAALCAAQVLAQAVSVFLQAKTPDGKYALFPNIEFRGIMGNEARFDKKINFAQPWRNWDWVIYQFISLCLGSGGNRIKYNISPSSKMVVVDLGWTFLLTHGNEVRGWAGIPWYGFNRANAQEQYKRKERGGFDYHLCGHFHTGAEFDQSGETYVCLALCGYDGYSHNALGVGGGFHQGVGQTLLAITEELGVISKHQVRPRSKSDHPFIYDKELAIKGAYTAMETWTHKAIDITGD